MFSPHFKLALVREVFADDSAYGALHDVVYEVSGDEITEEEAKLLFFQLDELIQCDALKWGLSDTEVRDNIYTELLKQRVMEEDNE